MSGDAAVPVSGHVPATPPGRVLVPLPGCVPAPTLGWVPAPTSGHVPAPPPGKVPAHPPGHILAPLTGRIPAGNGARIPRRKWSFPQPPSTTTLLQSSYTAESGKYAFYRSDEPVKGKHWDMSKLPGGELLDQSSGRYPENNSVLNEISTHNQQSGD